MTFSVAPVTIGEVVFCSSALTKLQYDDSVNETRTKCLIKSASIKLDLYSTVLTKKKKNTDSDRPREIKTKFTLIHFPTTIPGEEKRHLT